jgi:peptidoglycan/xylan/chitin deacetylase (PgdA/CDA1 family)
MYDRPILTRDISRTGRGLALVVLLAAALLGLPALPAAHAAAPVTVSLVFNDGLATQYRNAAPLMESRGVDGTFYVASNWVKSNDAKYMRYYHLDDLYRQGNEIGGMGKDHKNLTATYDSDPAADLAYKRDQVCGDHEALSIWGYHPVSFAYTAAAENATVQEIVRDCGFTTGRVAGGLSPTGPTYAEPIPPANPLRLRALSTPAGPLSLQTLQNAVTAAGAQQGGWLPIAFNDVCKSTDANYQTCMSGNKPVDAAVLDSFLEWLGTQESEGVTTQTVRQVMGSEQPPLLPRPFAVSLTFDDGLRSHYGLKDIFARHGVNGTFYINAGAVDAGEAGVMPWSQIRELQDAGNDVGGHTIDHVNLLATDTSYEFKTRQVCDDRARLFEEGINAVSFAYPFGAMNLDATAFPRGCGYQSARKAGTVTSDGPIYSETIPVTENPWAIRILGTNYNGPVTLDALQYAVNQAMKYGGSWLPTLFHQICYAGTPTYDTCMAGYRPVSDTTIDDFLSWIASQADRNISVRTVADVMGGGSTAPVVAVTAPTNGSTTSAARPELSGTATGGGDVSVAVYSGDYSVGTPVATLTAPVSNGTWTVQPGSDLPDGSYTVQTSQPQGNAVGVSLPVRFTVDSTAGPSDTTAPEVTITDPTSGDTVRTATPAVSGTAGTHADDESSVTLRYYAGSAAGGTPVATETAAVSADGSWSTTAPALGDGVYTVEASQADQTGNVGTSAGVTFTVDTTPVDTTAPSVSVTSPSEGETVTSATPTLSGTAGTASGDDSQVQVTATPTVGEPEDAQTLTADVAADGSWSVPTGPLADGSWTVQATQTDASGNIGTSAAVTFTVATAQAGPAIASVTPGSLGQGAASAPVTLLGSGFDAGSTITVSGSGVSATVADRSATTLSALVSVTTGAAMSARNVTVTNGDGRSTTCTGCLTVVAGPTISAVSPTSVRRGTQPTVTIDGSGFRDGQMVASFSGSGVTISSLTVSSATRMTAVLNVASNAGLSSRSLTVTDTGTFGRAVRSSAIQVVR